jgi:acetylornithine deacetylase
VKRGADPAGFQEPDFEEVVSLTRNLVQIPSENRETWGSEGDCQRYVAEWMRTVFDEVDVFTPDEVLDLIHHPAYWPGRNYSDRPNVVGVLKGKGGGRSLLLHGHIDVVPQEPLPWVHAPFGGVIEAGKLFGRGGLDQKGGLAAALIAAKIVKRSRAMLKGDLIVESVVDEENAGANGTLACIVRGYLADGGISTEPTGGEIHTTNRSGKMYRIISRSEASGLSQGTRAVFNPAFVIGLMAVALQELEQARNSVKSDHELFRELSIPLPVMLAKMKAGLTEDGSTLSIPKEAWLQAWIYGMPGITEEELDAEVLGFLSSRIDHEPYLSEHPPEIIGQTRFLEPSHVPADHPVVQELKLAIQAGTGSSAVVKQGGTTSDTGIVNRWGNIPMVTCGPGGGNIHDADEYVNVKDLLNAVRIYVNMILRWCV